jgi:hypothetical protein
MRGPQRRPVTPELRTTPVRKPPGSPTGRLFAYRSPEAPKRIQLLKSRSLRKKEPAVRDGCHDRHECCDLNLTVPERRGGRVSPEDATGMEDRMDAIRLKQILGAPLTEQELMCLQIEQNGFGCHACPDEPPPPSFDDGSSFG